MLGAVALAGLRPWASSSVVPNLSLAPGIGVGVDDSTAIAQAGSSDSAGTGGIAAPRSAPTVSAPVAVSAPGRRDSQPVLAVSAGRALSVATPAPAATSPAPEPTPPSEPVAATPAPAPAAPPALPPVVASVPSGTPGTSGGPITSGPGGLAPEQSCEGDEYLITVTFEEAEELDYEEAEADIVVRQIDADGNETEVQLRGDLSDVRNLIATLVAEGNCVHLEASTTAGDGTPSGGTSPAVVPTEGVPSPAADLVSEDQAAPNSP